MIQLKFLEKYDLQQTIECGQIFRYFKTSDNPKKPVYFLPVKDRILKIEQIDDNSLGISSNRQENLETIVNDFFRLQDKYLDIISQIQVDDLMKEILRTNEGLHLLKQDPFECMISFMVSQCSNIPRITKNLNSLAKNFGKRVEFEHQDFYLFPTREELIENTEEHYRDLGLGYRAKYIHEFVQNTPKIFTDNSLTGEKLNKALKNIYGVGQKVADCVQLFGFGDLSYFPVDTWMRKFMQKHYFNNEKTPLKAIREKGTTLFGKWAGYAQEFIYHYARCYDSF